MNAFGQLAAAGGTRQAGRRAAYTAEVSPSWAAVASRWSGARTPFHDTTWLGSWYAAFADRPGIRPVLVEVRDGASAVAMRLPLILREIDGLRVIEFADLLLTDYNAPLLGPAAPDDARSAAQLWRAVRRRLPPADMIRLAKMPRVIGGRPNPLMLLPGTVTCALNGNVVRIGEDYDAWRYGSLVRKVRKELERSWRVFSQAPGAAFVTITDPVRAQAVFAQMEAQQQVRMDALGLDYWLDAPDVSRFYRALLDRGLADGTITMTALLAGDEVVAGLVALHDADNYVLIRISQAGGRWSNCSPGRLVIERTMAALHAQGRRTFDFSIGNYDYKRRFGVEPVTLVDQIAALSWRGLVPTMRARLVGKLRDHPDFDRRARVWFGRVNLAKVSG